MTAYIPLERYIVKEETPCGVGVRVSLDEESAARESSRRKNVASVNRWLCVGVPERESLLAMDAPLSEQSPKVSLALGDRNFLMTLFVREERKVYEGMDSLVSGPDPKAEAERVWAEFRAEKLAFLKKMGSGRDVLEFVNGRCRTHDMAISSALLYSAGIKGAVWNDGEERILLFNAAKDIKIIEPRQGRVEGSRLRI